MLDLDKQREPAPARDAATLILVRNASRAIEVFCVERHKKSAFLGGAIVFPGGKVEPSDADTSWEPLTTRPGDPSLRAHAIAACRESLEEAAILPVAPLEGSNSSVLTHDELLDLRARAKSDDLRALLEARGVGLDLAALRFFARWITPLAENRRFDTRFFVCVAPAGQPGAHDDRETTRSFWASPADVLARYERGSVELAPPTHRTLDLLAQARSTDDALALADGACKEPICPKLVPQGDTIALTLPGDPEHEIGERRTAGTSRFVLRGERWVPEDAPRRE
jgi:8-oxo-dGTP pyrophosphatase MutT (NUDIX family)